MKKLFLVLLLIVTFIGYSQDKNSIIMNDPYIKETFDKFVEESYNEGLYVQAELLSKIDYIFILPDVYKVEGLVKTDLKKKMITLDVIVLGNQKIIKELLYREFYKILEIEYGDIKTNIKIN